MLKPLKNWAVSLLVHREYSLALLILLTGGIVSLVDPGFLQSDNLIDIVVRSAPTAIVACGVMLVVVTGEIDISVGSLMSVLAASMGVMLSRDELGLSMWIGLPTTLLLGLTIGLITGLLVTLGRVPSIIATLGLLTALRGTTTVVMGGENIDALPSRLSQATKYGAFGLPLSVWTAAIVVGMTGYLISYHPVGRRLYAVGSNLHSARMVGLSETRLKIFVFAYVGFLTAVATIVDVPRLPKIESGIGVGFELLVVTCVVVGGVSISGGRGSIWGVLLAVLLMTMIRPVLTFLDIGAEGEKWTKAIQGAFIILAVVTDSLMSRHHALRIETAEHQP
jgi:ribose/xylose/arabinose/galactoside ABC-type transport system permease subunit